MAVLKVMLIQDLVWTQAKVISSNQQMSSTNIPLHFWLIESTYSNFQTQLKHLHRFPTSYQEVLSKQKLDELTKQIFITEHLTPLKPEQDRTTKMALHLKNSLKC